MDKRDTLGRFVQGHQETPETRIKRINANRLAWKSREDYIGDIKEKCPRLYNIWRGIRFTNKGKKIGCSKEWENYRNFFNDVFPSYKDGLLMRRPDTTKPYSIDNYIWVSKEDESAFKSNSIYLTYNNETLLLKDWADKLNISLHGLRIRYHRHKDEYTVEEILFGRKKNRNTKRPQDISDEGVKIRIKASKMISSYKHKDKIMGVSVCDMDIEWMAYNILTKPCVYCGDTFRIGADRIDNSKGHTKDNVVPCCYECNCARNANFTHKEMFIIGKAIAKIKESRESCFRNEITLESSLQKKIPSQVRWGGYKTLQFDLEGNLINTFSSIKEASEVTGFNAKGISSACNGKDYNHINKYKGFIWKHIRR